jgi:hypothetical protein
MGNTHSSLQTYGDILMESFIDYMHGMDLNEDCSITRAKDGSTITITVVNDAGSHHVFTKTFDVAELVEVCRLDDDKEKCFHGFLDAAQKMVAVTGRPCAADKFAAVVAYNAKIRGDHELSEAAADFAAAAVKTGHMQKTLPEGTPEEQEEVDTFRNIVIDTVRSWAGDRGLKEGDYNILYSRESGLTVDDRTGRTVGREDMADWQRHPEAPKSAEFGYLGHAFRTAWKLSVFIRNNILHEDVEDYHTEETGLLTRTVDAVEDHGMEDRIEQERFMYAGTDLRLRPDIRTFNQAVSKALTHSDKAGCFRYSYDPFDLETLEVTAENAATGEKIHIAMPDSCVKNTLGEGMGCYWDTEERFRCIHEITEAARMVSGELQRMQEQEQEEEFSHE